MGALNALIEAFKELIKGIPTWAKIVLCFAIFLVLAVVSILNHKLVMVYDIHVLERNAPDEMRQYTVEHVQSRLLRQTDDRQRFDVYLEAGVTEPQRNEIVIRRKTVVTAGPVDEIQYAFSSNSWTSDVFNFDLHCDFTTKECKKLGTKSYESIQEVSAPGVVRFGAAHSWPGRVEAGEARSTTGAGIVVPTLATLRRVATEGGYMGVAFRKIQVIGDPCKLLRECKGTLYAEVEWNGKRLLYDGLNGRANGYFDLSITADRKVVGEIALAVENVLFTEAENQLVVKLYPRGTGKAGEEPPPADRLTRPVVLFREVKSEVIKSEGAQLQAEIEIRAYRDEYGRVYELFVASGSDERAIRKLQQEFGSRVKYQFQGLPVVGMLRPPLPPNRNWGLVAGVKSVETGRVRILFTQDEVKRLQTELRSYALNQGLGSLQPSAWFPYKLRDIQ